MKKQIILAIFSLTFLFISCLSEEENIKSPENEKGKITFALPAPTVSYATVSASADENLLKKLNIYMFNEEEVLEYIYADVTTNGSGASRSTSIDVTGRSGAKTFYFAANSEGQSAELDNVVVGTTTLDEFKEVLTDKQTALIKASDGLLMSAVKTISDVTADLTVADKTVNLRRRVARFDVLNDASVTNLTINKIMISKANLRSYLFEDATGTPAKTIEADKLPVVDFNTTDYPNANTATASTSVFYIYPTSLEQGKTEISIEGLFNGVTKVYTVNLPAATPINANYRYILKAKKMDIAHIEWEIAIDEWEDGSEVEIEPGNSLFTFSGLTFSGGTNGMFDDDTKTYDLTAATTPTAISFRTSSINKLGTKATVVYKYDTDASSLPGFAINTPEAVLTYGASYIQDYTINIPVQTEKIPIRVEITIWDAVSPVRKEVIVIHSLPNYDNTALKPVLVGGIYWAPVNVGASTVDATTMNQASMGLMFQWGRKNGTVYDATGDLVPGPVSLASTIGAGANAAKFIKTDIEPHNWLDNTSTQAEKNALWSDDANNPCPNGWRVPTADEITILSTKYNANRNFAANRASIAGDVTGTLYLPAVGVRVETGGGASQGSAGYYWTSSVASTYAFSFGFNSGGCSVYGSRRAGGLAVRCVQK